jgi:hypothetical protein
VEGLHGGGNLEKVEEEGENEDDEKEEEDEEEEEGEGEDEDANKIDAEDITKQHAYDKQ